MQALRAGDLGEPDCADVADLGTESAVHLLVDAVRLDRNVVEVGATVHRPLALLTRVGPVATVLEESLLAPLTRHLDEQFERRLGIGHDPVVGCEHAPDLRRLDVDVHECPAPGVDVDAAGVAVCPAVADPEHEVRGEQRRVAVPVRGLQAGHARHQRMVVGDRAPAHQRRDHRNVQELGQLDERLACIGEDDPAASDDQRALRLAKHPQRLLDLGPGRARFVGRERCVGVRVELDLGHLHIDREVDQDRAGPSRVHQVEGLLERPRHLGGLEHGHRQLRQRLGDRGDVDGLEVLLVQPRHRRLPGDAEDRDRVRRGGVRPVIMSVPAAPTFRCRRRCCRPRRACSPRPCARPSTWRASVWRIPPLARSAA